MVISVRALSLALISIFILIMAAHFSEYIAYAISAVYYRFEIFDAEGIVWQQAMLIAGPKMYGDINSYPFIVFHYPPLYHLLVRAASLSGCSPLFAGRAISLAATIISAAAISTLTMRLVGPEVGRLARVMGGVVSGLVFFCFYPVILTSTLMRVDMPAIAFGYIGLNLFTTSRIYSWRPYVGMVFFVLAVFTKQTSIAAVLAATMITGLVAPRQTLKLLGFGFVLGAAPLSILMWMTDGRFLRHLVSYNINRYYPGLIWSEVSGQALHIVFVLIAFLAIVLWWRRFFLPVKGRWFDAWRDALIRDPKVRAMAMVTLYLGLSTLMLAGLGKNGAGLSYFDEWVGILSILLGVLIAAIVAPGAATGSADIPLAPYYRLLLPILLIVQVLSLPAKGRMDFSDPTQTRESNELVETIARADKPVLSADMVMLMLAGKQVPWEPAIFTELASLGRWDENQIIQMITAHKFAFVVTETSTVFTPGVASAVTAAYPRVSEIAHHFVHLAPE